MCHTYQDGNGIERDQKFKTTILISQGENKTKIIINVLLVAQLKG